jgi:hypothetical protein
MITAQDLCNNILAWWEEHRYDTQADGDGGELKTYDEDPEFVTMAKQMKEESDWE